MNAVHQFDRIVVGAGAAGLPAAIRAADNGAKVLLIEKTDNVGGTLGMAREMSAAGARPARERDIEDSAELHFRDVMELSKGVASSELVGLAVEHAGETLDWLERIGVVLDPDTPKIVFNHEAYSVPRTYWAVDGGKGVVRALSERLTAHTQSGQVTLKLSTSFDDFITDGQKVVGVRVTDTDGTSTSYRSPKTLLATGGYAANHDLYSSFHGCLQKLEWAPAYAQGEGLARARDLGAELVGHDGFTVSFGAVLDDDGPRRKIVCRLNTLAQFRLPWEIFVNIDGERFLREDDPSIDAQEAALVRQPEHRGYMVFDEKIRREAPDRFRKWYIEPAEEDFENLKWFYKADSWEALATAAGISPEGLVETCLTYNRSCETGKDHLGRQHMPAPISEPPYYAIRFEGCNVVGCVGVRTDASLRPLRPDGSAIEGLYVAGEILGSAQLMGRSGAGGMMVTPALTFGRLFGETA